MSASMASRLASGTKMRRVSASALKPSWMMASAICSFAALTAKPSSRKVPTAILAWMAYRASGCPLEPPAVSAASYQALRGQGPACSLVSRRPSVALGVSPRSTSRSQTGQLDLGTRSVRPTPPVSSIYTCA